MQTKVIGIKIHTPAGVIDVDPETVLAMTLQPYPVIVLKPDADGHFKRYSNFPIEFLDEETSIVRDTSSLAMANGKGHRQG